MAERSVNPWIKTALELGPIVLFLVAYLRLKDRVFEFGGTEYDGFIVVTAAFIPLLLICTGILWALTGKLSRMQILTVVLVVVFGALTVWLNDGRYFMMKPTAIYLIFAVILGIGLMRGRSYLQYVMEELMPLQPEGWMILTKRLALFFAALAILNEVVWRSMGEQTWVWFKTIGLTVAIFAFFLSQAGLLNKYELKEESDPS